mmetsp:Transcript_55355/g.108360  ORF Transcript_55355/g.108360 Transcript_55355/m.108360 type:complete len:126 (-) Transcript_55355:823-1200(-)
MEAQKKERKQKKNIDKNGGRGTNSRDALSSRLCSVPPSVPPFFPPLLPARLPVLLFGIGAPQIDHDGSMQEKHHPNKVENNRARADREESTKENDDRFNLLRPISSPLRPFTSISSFPPLPLART